MSLAEDRALLSARRWRGAFVILASAAAFAALAIVGTLTVPYAIAGFAVVATAALMLLRSAQEQNRFSAPIADVEPDDNLLRAVVAGLPDPVVALTTTAFVISPGFDWRRTYMKS